MTRELEMLKIHEELLDSLKVSVKIGHDEVLKLVIRDLIAKRNRPTNEITSSFDAVLLYYLGDKDFEKYVINGEDLDN